MQMVNPRSWNEIQREGPCVVTLGNFDGVHLGHHKIFEVLIEEAHKKNLEPVLITFMPHPVQYFKRDENFALINTVEEKLELLKSIYPFQIILLSFDKLLARLDAETFINQFLKKRLHAQSYVFGYDNHFGMGGRGNAESLVTMGGVNPNEITVVKPLQVNGITIGSTKIRKFVSDGDIQQANQLLGYRFFYRGEVVRGKGMGRLLGFPTANIQVTEPQKLKGPLGVYGAVAKLADKEYYALVNIGKNPTFGDNKVTIEAYLLDFDQDIYGQNLTIELESFRRKEMKFSTKEELINQIEWDINNFKQSLD